MKGDDIVSTQLLMAQGFGALADLVTNSNAYRVQPTLFADLPAPVFDPDVLPGPQAAGAIACIKDSNVNVPGAVTPITGGGTYCVLAWFNGTNWTVIGV